MTNDELKTLVDKVYAMDDDCDLILSSKQSRWLHELFNHADFGNFHKINENSIKFLNSCANGAYSE